MRKITSDEYTKFNKITILKIILFKNVVAFFDLENMILTCSSIGVRFVELKLIQNA
jgi:hypothetical protein